MRMMMTIMMMMMMMMMMMQEDKKVQRWEKNSPSSKPVAHRHADRHNEVPTFASTLCALYLDAEIKKTNKQNARLCC